MNNVLILSSILLWIVVLFNLLLTVALIRRGSATQPGFEMENVEMLEIGSQAPDFTAETLDDKTVTLADYAGKSVALIFISPTCQPCLDKLPELHELAPHTRHNGMGLILVNAADTDQTRVFVEKHNVTLPILIAPRNTNPFMNDYKVAGTPFFCILDKSATVQSTGYFDSNWHNLITEWTGT